MKHSNDFCAELFRYNKVHRLIGNVSCETLVSESCQAIKAEEPWSGRCMIDVGAGAGILGFAWLKSNLNRRLVLVEPDAKAQGFLRLFFSGNPRVKIFKSRLEQVDLAEVRKFEADLDQVFLAARAFSSSVSLAKAHGQSAFATRPLFVFSKKNGVCRLIKSVS